MNQGEHLQKGRCFSFIFERVCALVARIKFFLSVKWLALRAGQRQGGVFRLPPLPKKHCQAIQEGVK